MTNEPEFSTEHRLEALAFKRQQLADIEREWKKLRDQSRSITLQLITVDGFSVAKASELSGHHRNSIKVWLDLWNAEQNAARKAK